MPKPTGPTNPELKNLIEELRNKGLKYNNNFLLAVSEKLEKPRRIRSVVNISKINRYVKEGEIALVPGKVLSAGDLNKKITVAGFSFSKEAKEKIEKAKGKAISIKELIEENPEGKGVRIIG